MPLLISKACEKRETFSLADHPGIEGVTVLGERVSIKNRREDDDV